MNEIIIFENEEFGSIRTVEIENNPWFVGKDIANALGYVDTFSALKKHVEAEDKQNCQNDSFESNRGLTVINESGLYSLILSSKLPTAKKFKRWVTSEVLPAIRKNGKYEILSALPDDDEQYLDVTQLELDQRIRIASIIATCRRERLKLVAKVLSLDMESLNTPAPMTVPYATEASVIEFGKEVWCEFGNVIPVQTIYGKYRIWCGERNIIPQGKQGFGRIFRQAFPIRPGVTRVKLPDGKIISACRVYRKLIDKVLEGGEQA